MGARVTTVHGGREVWKYGDAGDRYPVQEGEVWEVGPHVLACGDLGRGAAAELLASRGAPDWVYVDPPWNQGNVNAFRSKAGLAHDASGFEAFLATVAAAATSATRGAFVEMGVQQYPNLVAAVRRAGWTEVRSWDVVYFRTRPVRLGLFAPAGSALTGWTPAVDPTGLDDTKTPGWALSEVARTGETAFDPCIGQGCTAEHAARLGLRVLGVELHPRRLAVTVQKLVALTGATPRAVGRLACM